MNEFRFNATIALEAAEQILAGACLDSWLEQASQAMTAEFEEIVELVRDSGYYEQSPEEIEVGLTALEGYLESLDLLAERRLEEAVERAREAEEAMLAALQLNECVRGELTFDVVCF